MWTAGYAPVLTLGAPELGVERAGAGAVGGGCGGGAGLALQRQVDGGADTALLQIHALNASLVGKVGRHEERAGE